MNAAIKLSLLASGLFLFIGLWLGVWKYKKIMASIDKTSPVYVDIAHRAALLYSFAALVIAKLLEYNPYPVVVQLIASGTIFTFFAIAVTTYTLLGFHDKTDNQFKERNFSTTWGMLLLIAGEIGGFAVILWGFIENVILSN